MRWGETHGAGGGGRDFQRGAGAAWSGWLEITNRCDPADKRSNLDKSQALELVACVPSLVCFFFFNFISEPREGEGRAGGSEG